MRSCVKKEKGGKEAAAARCHRPPKHFHFLSDPMLSRVTEQDDCIRRCRGPPIVRPPPFRLRALGVQQAETSLAEAWRGGTRACIGPAGPTALVLALARDEPEPRGPGGQHGPRAVPPPSRTNWTRLVPLPVLIGRVSSLFPSGGADDPRRHQPRQAVRHVRGLDPLGVSRARAAAGRGGGLACAVSSLLANGSGCAE
jgi:hypothetical protein